MTIEILRVRRFIFQNITNWLFGFWYAVLTFIACRFVFLPFVITFDLLHRNKKSLPIVINPIVDNLAQFWNHIMLRLVINKVLCFVAIFCCFLLPGETTNSATIILIIPKINIWSFRDVKFHRHITQKLFNIHNWMTKQTDVWSNKWWICGPQVKSNLYTSLKEMVLKLKLFEISLTP